IHLPPAESRERTANRPSLGRPRRRRSMLTGTSSEPRLEILFGVFFRYSKGTITSTDHSIPTARLDGGDCRRPHRSVEYHANRPPDGKVLRRDRLLRFERGRRPHGPGA